MPKPNTLRFAIATGMLLVSGLMSGCSESTLVAHSVKRIGQDNTTQTVYQTSAGTYKIGSPYQIQGKWYTPQEDMSYVEEGTASWYGPNFHGKRTANGEVFDMYAMTAAHRTLPMPSVVRVTNLRNQKSIILRVNDRGPFAHNRIIDVSKAAATALGFTKQGTTRVRVEVMADESIAMKSRIIGNDAVEAPVPVATTSTPMTPQAQTSAPKPVYTKTEQPAPLIKPKTAVVVQPVSVSQSSAVTADSGQFIQIGAFGDLANAARLKTRLQAYGPVEVVKTQSSTGVTLHKVRIGPIMVQQEADAIRNKMQELGFVDAHLVGPSL